MSTSAPTGTGGHDGAEPDGPSPDDQARGRRPARPARWTPCRATARGSTRQACSSGSSGGRSVGTTRIDPHLVGQSPVDADPVSSGQSAVGHCCSLPRQAGGTRPAGHPRAVRPPASRRRGARRTRGPRVTGDGPERNQVEVGPADTRAGHRDPHPGRDGCGVDVDDPDTGLGVPHGAHGIRYSGTELRPVTVMTLASAPTIRETWSAMKACS